MMSLVNNLIGPVTGLLDKVIEDKDQKAALAHEIATMSDNHAQQALMGQLEINKAEAASGSLFKGGWRPFIGWVCGVAFAYHFVLQPLIVFGVTAAGIDIPELPEFDMGSLMTVMMGKIVGISEKVEESVEYTRDIKNGLKDDILRIEQQTDRIEDMVRESEDKVRSMIDDAEVRFENQRERVRVSQSGAMKELEETLMDKLQRALDNPLAD
jgi:hypothetical protein